MSYIFTDSCFSIGRDESEFPRSRAILRIPDRGDIGPLGASGDSATGSVLLLPCGLRCGAGGGGLGGAGGSSGGGGLGTAEKVRVPSLCSQTRTSTPVSKAALAAAIAASIADELPPMPAQQPLPILSSATTA